MRAFELEREVEQEDAETRRKRYERKVQNAISLEQLEMILKEKHGGDYGSILRVYIDRDTKRYYIDTFAAYSLGFLSYHQAADRYDSGNTLYEISPAMLSMLENVFEDRIEYRYLPIKENKSEFVKSDLDHLEDNYEDILNKYIDYKKINTEKYKENLRDSKDELEEIFKDNQKELIGNDDYIDPNNNIKHNK